MVARHAPSLTSSQETYTCKPLAGVLGEGRRGAIFFFLTPLLSQRLNLRQNALPDFLTHTVILLRFIHP